MPVEIDKSDDGRYTYRLTTELLVAEPRKQVFAFFADAFQLEKITPPWLRFSVQTPPPIEMQTGALIDYRLRLHGLPIRWRTQISQWDPPNRFVDEQIKGPYRAWHHLHTFDQCDGGTRVRDVVHYSLLLGCLLHPLIVRRDLRKIFDYRHDAMCRIFSPQLDTDRSECSSESAEQRHPLDAVHFVRDAMTVAMEDRELTKSGHLDAAAICRVLLELAVDHFGEMGQQALIDWNISRSEDVGVIVERLIDAGGIRREQVDDNAQFDGLFDLNRPPSDWSIKWQDS